MRTSSRLTLAVVLALPAALARPAAARTLLSQAEALKVAFPASQKVERRTAYLTEEQRQAAEQLGRARVESRLWTYYVGLSTAGVDGYAYFETHVVRTMPETFMAVLDAGGSVRFVELLSFSEPEDYLPKRRWLDQFAGRPLDGELMVRRAIRNITGASLTAAALTDGVRRVLAVHRTVHDGPTGEKVQSRSLSE